VAKHKTIAKELKRPDQFVDFWTHASRRLVAVLAPRQKPAIAAAVAIAVVVIGAAIFNYWDGSRHLAASRKLSRIQEIANAELLGDASDPREGGSHKDDAPRFKTSAEREGAVLKEGDQFLSGDATAGLKDEGLIIKGAALLTLSRYDEALTTYQASLAAKLDPRLRFLAYEGLGYSYEGKGDLDKALGEFAKMTDGASGPPGFYEDRALYHKARLTALKGDKAGAVTIYRQILTKVPDTGLKDEITDRLALIEAK